MSIETALKITDFAMTRTGMFIIVIASTVILSAAWIAMAVYIENRNGRRPK